MRTAAACSAFPLSAAVVWLLLQTGIAARVEALPRSERWHRSTTPLLGGVGIFAAFLGGVGTALAAGALRFDTQLGGILAGCAVVFAVGLLDDILELGALTKLAAQVLAAALALAGGLSVDAIENSVLAALVAAVWLVGMTNAFNFLDNMDGLAASLAAVAAFYFALDAYLFNENVVALVLAISLGLAAAGFLPFNVRRGRPAAIFMGDSGSQTLGFALAALGLLSSYKAAGSALAPLVVPLLILAVPLVDTALVTVVRLLEGRPVHEGGRDHSSHRLVSRGLSERRALALLVAVAASLGATSLAYSVVRDGRLATVGVLLTFAALVQFASFLGDLDRSAARDARREGRLRGLVVHRRRLAEVVVDSALVAASFLAAYALVVGGAGTASQRSTFLLVVPIVLVMRYAAFIPFGLYRGVWRYASARDAGVIVAAVLTSGAAAYAASLLLVGLGDVPATVFAVDAVLCTLLVGASRFGERTLQAAIETFRPRETQCRIVLVGAGRAGRSLLRELRETPGERVVAFVDDDPRLRHRRLQGVPVRGGMDELPAVLATAAPDLVLVTIPDAPRDRLASVVSECDRAGVPCRLVRRDANIDPGSLLTPAASQ